VIRTFLHTPLRRAIAVTVLLLPVLNYFLSLQLSFHVYSIVSVVPYGLSIPLLWGILAEYKVDTTMYSAWFVMLISALLGGLRHLIDIFQLFKIHVGILSTNDISMVVIVFSLITLVVSLMMMLGVFRTIGIRVPLQWRDELLLSLTAALGAVCFFWADTFPHHASASWLIRYLEYANPILLTVGSIAAIKLYRFRQFNGTSAWSISLFGLVLELVGRLLAFVMYTLSARYDYWIFNEPEKMLYYYAPWLFLIAVVARRDVTECAVRYAVRESEDARYVVYFGSRTKYPSV
jgi:hypothetical protein